MAGIFYSLQEVCEKLGKSEDEIRQLVQEGKLREFRDGSNLLFKVEDVDVLSGGGGDSEIALSIDDSGELSLASGQIDTAGLSELVGEDTKTSDSSSETDAKIGEDTDLANLTDTKTNEDTEDAQELSMEELTGEELDSEDTKFATAGSSINVLGGTEDGYNLTDDTSGETKLLGDEEEATLGRLDDDMNLDSFGGSGSGLLDLSLQADDTSLGAVLDDIYPESSEGGDEGVSGGVGVVEVDGDGSV